MLKLNKAKYIYLKSRNKGVFAAELVIGHWSLGIELLPITHYLKSFIVAIELNNCPN